MITKLLKFLRVPIIEGIVIILLILFMPNLPPNAKISQPYKVTPALPFEGKLALNEKLNNAEIIFKGDLHGPEAFAVYNGELYTSVHGGDVVKIVGNSIVPIVKFGKPCKGIYEEHICGRPLGLAFDKNGILYVADTYYGLYKVNVKTGKYEQLVSINQEIGNKKPKLPNSLVVATNGDIYWTDSSTEFRLYDGIFDVLSDGSGRLIHYNAKTKANTVLMDNIHFSNGIYLSKDESFIVVAQTPRNRLLRYYVKGVKKGTSDVFLDGLPGMPDNLQSDGKGGFFVPLVVSVDSANPQILQSVTQFPLVRKFAARILGLSELVFKLVNRVYPNEWVDKAIHGIGSFGMVWNVVPTPKRFTLLHVSESGKILDSFHALDGKLTYISDVIVFKNALYLGSPTNDFLARVSLSKAGLTHLADVKSEIPKEKPAQTTPPPSTTKPTTKAPPPTPTKATSPPSTAAPSSPKTTPPPQKATTPQQKQTPSPQKTTPPPQKDSVSQQATQSQPKTTTPPPKASSPSNPPTKEVKSSTTKPTPASPTLQASSATKAPSTTEVPPTTKAAPPTTKTTPPTTKTAPPTTKTAPPTTKTASPTTKTTPPANPPPTVKATEPKGKPKTTTPPEKVNNENIKPQTKKEEPKINQASKEKK